MIAKKVLDSYAILAFFHDEPGAAAVEELFLAAQAGTLRLLISVVNLGEVWYSVARAFSAAVADEKVALVRAMPIEIVDADWPLTRQAAELKSGARIAFADCLAASLTLSADADLVTGDPDFRGLADQIRIQWL